MIASLPFLASVPPSNSRPRTFRRFQMKLLRYPVIALTLAFITPLSAQEEEDSPPQEKEYDYFAEGNKIYDYAKTETDRAQQYRAFSACIPLFERFVNNNPKHPEAPKAIYRAGVANLLIGKRTAAETKFVITIKLAKRKGQIAAAASFRLGALAYNSEHFKTALPHFTLAANETDKPDLRHKALNYEARCLLLEQKIPQAEKSLRRLVNDPFEPNIFKHQASLALAHIAATTDKLEEAYGLYENIAQSDSLDPGFLPIKAQAIVHGGMTAMRLGKSKEGLSMLNTALTTAGLPDESKAEAQLMLMQHEFGGKKFAEVQNLFRLGPFQAARPETTAEILLFAGRASAKLGQHNAAVEMFIGVDRAAPNSKLAFEASYRKLLSFYTLRGTNVPDLSASFVELYKRKYPNSAWIQEARVMRAETYFSFSDYAQATSAWEKVNFSKLPEKLKGPSYFKSGWSLVENGDYNSAINVLSEFISRYPESPDLMAAVAKRAESYLEVGDRISALSDFERVLEAKPKTPLAAFALQLSGRLYRMERRNEKMLESYQTLLSDYNNLSQDTVARANYDMGLGYFDQGEFETSLIHLNKARSLVPEFYEEPAGTTIALCHYRLKDSDSLRQTLARLYSINPEKKMPRRLLVWLGLQMYEKSNFIAADHYLSRVVDNDEPGETEKGIWKSLAKSRLEVPGQEERALEATNMILANENDAFWRSDAFLDRSNALIALERWTEAEISAHRGLDLDPQGTIKAGLHLALGDISLAYAHYSQAASSYVRAAELFLNDSSIQPNALHKAAWCLNKAGETNAAQAFEERLKMDHPEWKAPKTFKVTPGSANKPKPAPAPATTAAPPAEPAPAQPTAPVSNTPPAPALPAGVTPINN